MSVLIRGGLVTTADDSRQADILVDDGAIQAVGDDLEVLLDRATSEFINERANVSVDHANNTIYLSTIFKWYEKDFARSLKREPREAENSLQAYVADHSPIEQAEALRASTDRGADSLSRSPRQRLAQDRVLESHRRRHDPFRSRIHRKQIRREASSNANEARSARADR